MIISVLSANMVCSGQTIPISDPRLGLKDNVVQISYDILDSNISDTFQISLDITNSRGHRINANALEGDIGPHVPGGYNKLITWDLTADQILMNEDLFFKIHARAVLPPEPIIITKQEEHSITPAPEEQSSDPPAEDQSSELLTEEQSSDPPLEDQSTVVPEGNLTMRNHSMESYSRTGIILQSLALPGLGLSRMTGQPHWVRGVVGYGCIAGSVAYYTKAKSTFGEYQTQTTVDGASELYKASTRQDLISEILVFTAIGIWATDMVWTILSSSGLKGMSSQNSISGLSVSTSFEPRSRLPLLGIRYSF